VPPQTFDSLEPTDHVTRMQHGMTDTISNTISALVPRLYWRLYPSSADALSDLLYIMIKYSYVYQAIIAITTSKRRENSIVTEEHTGITLVYISF
jgi:hypothetical protein